MKKRIKSNFLEEYIPEYLHHVNDFTLLLENKNQRISKYSLLATFKLHGVPFESLDDYLLEKQFERLNQFLINLGKKYDSRLKLWLHFRRKKKPFEEEYHFNRYFSSRFAKRYLNKFEQNEFFENSFFITFVFLTGRDLDSAVEEFRNLIANSQEALVSYSLKLLGTYKDERGTEYSEIASFLNFLLTFKDKLIPVTNSYVGHMICDSRHSFYENTLAIEDGRSATLFAKTFEMIDFGVAHIGVLEDILKINAEFLFTQIFSYLGEEKIIGALDRQLARFRAKRSDHMSEQQEELLEAKNGVEARKFFFGEYDAIVTVFNQDLVKLKAKAVATLSAFEKLNGYRFAECSIEHPNVFLSHLPGADAVRKKIKTTANLATTFPMYNFATGKAKLNPLGDGTAIMPLKTNSETLYYFNVHDTPLAANTIGKAIAGHILFLGKTGSGKSVLVAAILTFLDRFDPFLFSVDYKSGMEIFFRAMGGEYFTLKRGEATGMNPFQLPDDLSTREFLNSLIVTLAGHNISVLQQKIIAEAINHTMSLPFENRNMKSFMTFLDTSEPDLIQKLSIWLNESNKFGWVFDNHSNNFDPENFHRIGFDCAGILEENYPPCEPILMFLFFLKERMKKKVNAQKSFLITIVEEFWYATKFDMTRQSIESSLNAGRKEFETLFLVSQYPEQAINSQIFSPIVSGTTTKVFLANSQMTEGVKAGYIKCGLTDKEFNIVADFLESERNFLIKQNSGSVVSKLDLSEIEPKTGVKTVIPEMKILSTTLDNVHLVNELIKRYGLDSAEWVKEFLDET